MYNVNFNQYNMGTNIQILEKVDLRFLTLCAPGKSCKVQQKSTEQKSIITQLNFHTLLQ